MAAVKKLNNVMFSRYFSDSLRCFFLPSARFFRSDSSTESFKFCDLQIDYATDARRKPKPDPATLVFGETYSDHMFQVNWHINTGWDIPQILPTHLFQCHPGSKIFHYGQGVFEGMKAFRCSDDSINLFRPNLNVERLLASAERAALPLFDGEEFLKCLKKLICIDKGWIPDYVSSSLYIRPTFIGTQNSLGVAASNSAMLYIITCPVGPYFKSAHTEPVSLLADPTYVRAWPGGVGDKKMACNYAPSLYVQKLAQKQGLNQVLWLRGDNHQVAEAGAMNVFFFFQKGSNEYELATPSLDGTILPGVVRQSFLELTRQYNEFQVSERTITMEEVVKASEAKTLIEMFICGTAAVLCPVSKIRYLDKDIHIPTMMHKDPLYKRLHKALIDIQYGRVQSEWAVKVQ